MSDGLFWAIPRGFQRAINYERQYIWIRNFAQKLKPDSHLKCKELDEDALLNLQYNKSIGYVEKFWNIAYGAQRCFGVYEGDNLIAFGWVYHSDCPRYDLKKGEAFIGPAMTIKEFRRRGGYKNKLIHVSNLLREEGCSKIYSGTDIGNYPSINGLSSSDFRISHIQKRLLIFNKKIFSVKR